MAGSTLANLKACAKEFNPDDFGDRQNVPKQWILWLKNFEYCLDFEGVKEETAEEGSDAVLPSWKRAALLAIGGQKLIEVFKTLTPADDSYQAAKECLNEYFKPQKNLTAERYKVLCMKPESSEETHGHWMTRLRSEVRNCEIDKMNNDKAIKLVLTLRTH